MISKKSIGLFVGSGFSKAIFNIPTSEDLVKKIVDTDQQLNLVTGFRDEINNIHDIEFLIYHYQRLAASENDNDRYLFQNKLHTLRTALTAFFYEYYFRKPNYHLNEAKSLLKHYFKTILPDAIISDSDIINYLKEKMFIITTNSDLSIETVIRDMFKENNEPEPVFYYPGLKETEPANNENIIIYKLHGSMHWMEKQVEKEGRLHSLPVVEIRSDIWDLSYNFVQNSVGGKVYSFENQLYIPLVFTCFNAREGLSESRKCISSRICHSVWEQASEHIKVSDQLIFLGSGMPPAQDKVFAFRYDFLSDKAEQKMRWSNCRDSEYLETLVKQTCNHSDNWINLNDFISHPNRLLEAKRHAGNRTFDHYLRLF